MLQSQLISRRGLFDIILRKFMVQKFETLLSAEKERNSVDLLLNLLEFSPNTFSVLQDFLTSVPLMLM